MKKRFSALVLLFVLINLSQSCKPEHFAIVDIDFNAAKVNGNYNNKEPERNTYACTHSIKDRLIFVISYNTEYLYGYIPRCGNVCYATTVPRVNDNKLLRETFSITFNKPFVYYGDTISSTNILNIRAIADEISEYENNNAFCGMGADIVLDFSDTFFKNAVFDKTEEYIVTFSCETSDDKFFEKTTTLTFHD